MLSILHEVFFWVGLGVTFVAALIFAFWIFAKQIARAEIRRRQRLGG